jgi:hypothetical protein
MRYGLIALAPYPMSVAKWWISRARPTRGQARLQAVALPHEVVVHRGDGEQRRDRRPVGGDPPVGEDQDVDPGADRVVGLVARVGQALGQAARALGPAR